MTDLPQYAEERPLLAAGLVDPMVLIGMDWISADSC